MGDRSWRARAVGVAAAALAAGCLVMSGGDDRAFAQGERDVLAVAQEYFRALYAPDHDRVREVASPAMTFADPTAEGQAVAITSAASRDEFLAYMQANNAGSDAEAVVDRAFQTGRYATLYVTYRGTVDGAQLGRPGTRVEFETAGVTVLTVENGLVTHHQDYVDYETLDRQFGGELQPPSER